MTAAAREERLGAQVLSALQRNGVDITIERDNADHSIGSVPADLQTQPATSSDPVEFSSHLVNGESIRAGDAKVYVAARGLAWAPGAGDVAIVSGTRWVAVAVRTHALSGTVLLYELHVRRAA